MSWIDDARENHGKWGFITLNILIGLCLPVIAVMAYSLGDIAQPLIVPAFLLNGFLGGFHIAYRKTERFRTLVWILRIPAILLALALPAAISVRNNFQHTPALYGIRREMFLRGHYSYDPAVEKLLPENVPAGCGLYFYTGGAGIGPEARAKTFLFVQTTDKEWLQKMHAGRTDWETPDPYDEEHQMKGAALSWFRENGCEESFTNTEGEISAKEGRGVYLDENAGIYAAWLVY